MGRTTMRAASLLVCALLSATGYAGSNTVYNFLRSDVGARAAAMAGSFLSVTDDPTMVFYNPASLGTLSTPKGSVGFFKHLLDINAGHLAYAQDFEDIGYFGAGILYENYGSFTETDDLGTMLGSFSASDLAIAVGYSNTLQENLYYGAAVKFIHSSIATYSSSALAGDIGILYTIPEAKVTLGASVRNIGTQLSRYAGTREDLPLDVSIGGSIVPRGLPLLLNVGLHNLADDVERFGDRFRAFSVGGEFTLSKVFQARFGYNNAQRKDLKIGTSSGLAGFSGGVGVTVEQYKVDYALSSLGKVGSLHRISVSTQF